VAPFYAWAVNPTHSEADAAAQAAASGSSDEVLNRVHPAGTLRRAPAPGRPAVSSPGEPFASRPAAIRVDAAAVYPETFRYRLKNKVLGSPLTTDRLAVERLGRPTALAVLSSDVISSSAYASEQALIPLVQVVGVAAFSLLVPVSIAVIVVLAFVTLSYLEVVKVYTKAGGAYVVARENFGLTVAQVAAVSLLIDYTLTVAVSVAAGVAALTSVFPSLAPDTTLIAVALVVVICYANLRGVREAGRVFAVPTYFFIANMVVLITVGAARAVAGQLHAHSIHVAGAFHVGAPGSGLLYGASLFVILRSFASGGSALTGTEAISNGVSVFRRPESRNARITMMWMSTILGSLVLGVSSLAAITHPVPRVSGTPTVIAQLAKFVYGNAWYGRAGFVLLQASTMLILVLAANTSFTGFPYLASFAAADSYLPRQLTRRGHRLVFSTGILVLTVVSILLLVITRAQVDNLIPLYAIGVFTGFTMAGFGMLRFHLRTQEPHWRRRAVINGTAGALSAVVDAIIVVTKFNEGAWAIVVILPLGFLALLRLHRQYSEEGKELEISAAEATEAPLLRRHVVVVLVDRLDMAAARAIQYARTLAPDDLRAVHFDVDSAATGELEQEWGRLGLSRLPLDVVECPDRRLGRAAVELVADAVSDGDTECTILLPRRGFVWGWQRLLHDRTADKIATVVSQVPHVSATIVPFNLTGMPVRGSGLGMAQRLAALAMSSRAARSAVPAAEEEPAGVRPASGVARSGEPAASPPGPPDDSAAGSDQVPKGRREHARELKERGKEERERSLADERSPADQALARRAGGTRPIGDVEWRQRVRVAGRVTSVRVQPKAGTSNLECVLADRSGGILLVFQGRPRIPGIEPGARLVAEGMVGAWGRRLAILNPDYELVAQRERGEPPGSGPS
jgi:amino acid transporter